LVDLMSDLPTRIRIHEEVPRKSFQIESAAIPTVEKIRFIEVLALTGVPQIDCVSYVNPKRVPGMADADAVARGIHKRSDVRYTRLWLNVRGLERALTLPLDRVGAVRVTAFRNLLPPQYRNGRR
jgi:hydroxymethylglutaryl-CoA lyase